MWLAFAIKFATLALHTLNPSPAVQLAPAISAVLSPTGEVIYVNPITQQPIQEDDPQWDCPNKICGE